MIFTIIKILWKKLFCKHKHLHLYDSQREDIISMHNEAAMEELIRREMQLLLLMLRIQERNRK